MQRCNRTPGKIEKTRSQLLIIIIYAISAELFMIDF